MTPTTVAVLGDVHGHLQLALAVLARWQKELNIRFEVVFLCGDVGSFTMPEELDSATRRHGAANRCEFEFLEQWSADPQPPWLSSIFEPMGEGGLGLHATVVMVHGNHEGFQHLSRLAVEAGPLTNRAVPIQELPIVDTGGHIRYLPSGWRLQLESGLIAAGLGGIERGQRKVAYHDLAYIDKAAVAHLRDQKKSDILLTHQGPASLQGPDAGSPTLDVLLEEGVARIWFHGHSIRKPHISDAGPHGMQVVPLGDIAFPANGPSTNFPGSEGWAIVQFERGELKVTRETPMFLGDFNRYNWTTGPAGEPIAPPFAQFAESLRNRKPSGLLSRVTRKQGVMGGEACIRGMRVEVDMVAGLINAGQSIDEVIAGCPYLDREDVEQALFYASLRLEEREAFLAGP